MTNFKLIIQIPCFNEAADLPLTLSSLPREIKGFDAVEWLIIDDGSRDDTAEVAERCGVDHIIRHTSNRGLARAFMTGLDASLRLGADVIVNTDADNQYNADDIPALVEPILQRRADLVIGSRPIQAIRQFSATKKLLERLGSWVVRSASNTDIPDAPSGFRAMSRSAAQQMMVFSDYTYTLETIIQAGQKNMAITSVPIRINKALRPSRLVRNIPSYIKHSISTIVRIFIIYKPFRFFGVIAFLFVAVGMVISLGFLWIYLFYDGSGHIQSLILSSVLLIIGFQTLLVAFVADLISANRKLLEEIRYRQASEFDVYGKDLTRTEGDRNRNRNKEQEQAGFK